MPALRTRDTQSRTLEVSTDAPSSTPTLAIISPTPRAFTFPVSHNLSDSPYSSPSSSPFEPERYPLSFCSAPSTTSYRSQSPPSSIISASPDPLGHRRRQSSCHSESLERPLKKGDEGYVKRPENAFILFRRKCCEDRQAAADDPAATGPTKKQRQADLSKTISQQWKALSDEERKHWDQLAKERKKEHEAAHPGYVYRPQRQKDGRAAPTKAKKGKGKLGNDLDSDCMSFVMPMAVPRHHGGRSASAPTPPPTYQSVQVPNMYITPSCPSSPSLKPLIEHSSARPGEAMMSFDYQPRGAMAPPPFVGYEASLQPSEYLQHENMFINTSGNGYAGSLTMSPEELHLPHHFSPASSIGTASSGPSSPRSAHYTPLTNSLANAYTQLDEHGYIDPQTQAEIDLQIQVQHNFEYNPYGWDPDSTMWPAGTEMMVNEDFDINAIPPLTLETKYGGDTESASAMSEYSQEYSHDYSHDYSPHEYATENPYPPQMLSASAYPDSTYEDSTRYDDMLPPHSY